jgi:hypothetical protein
VLSGGGALAGASGAVDELPPTTLEKSGFFSSIIASFCAQRT